MVVDGEMATVGTLNFRYEKFPLKLKWSLLLHNEQFAKKVEEEFVNDLKTVLLYENTSKTRPLEEI